IRPAMSTIATTAPAMNTCHCSVIPGTVSPNTVTWASPVFSRTTATPTTIAASVTTSPRKIMRRLPSPSSPYPPADDQSTLNPPQDPAPGDRRGDANAASKPNAQPPGSWGSPPALPQFHPAPRRHARHGPPITNRGTRTATTPPHRDESLASGLVQLGKVFAGKAEARCGDVLAQVRNRRGTGDQQDVRRPVQQPRQRDRPGGGSHPGRDRGEHGGLEGAEPAERKERHVGDAFGR